MIRHAIIVIVMQAFYSSKQLANASFKMEVTIMRAARRTVEEQYRLVLECRRSGLSDSDWCRENGINPATFYTWITRLKKRGSLPIPPASSQSAGVRAHDIVRLDVLPEETVCRQLDDKNAFLPGRKYQTSASLIR